MARRSGKEKKPEKQLDLPSAPAPPTATKVLPMQLLLGDRITDETGECEIIRRPFTTAGGTTAHVGVRRRVGQPDVTGLRMWSAHEKVSGKRV